MKDNIRLLITLLVCSFLPGLSSSTAINSEHYVMGFGSCLTEKREQPIWAAIKEENLQEFIFMGDWITQFTVSIINNNGSIQHSWNN